MKYGPLKEKYGKVKSKHSLLITYQIVLIGKIRKMKLKNKKNLLFVKINCFIYFCTPFL